MYRLRSIVDLLSVAALLVGLLGLSVTVPVRWSGQWRYVASVPADVVTVRASR